MSDNDFIPLRPEWAAGAHVDAGRYQELYQQSVSDPDGFWGGMARELEWIRPFTRVQDHARDGSHRVSWFGDGVLNVCANCIDRHLPGRADQTAIIHEGDEPGTGRHISYRELHERVCRLASVLKELGVRKGDRVTIYLPMIPEVAIAMLACARIGAIHSVVFGGFSPESLAGRISDCASNLLITADEGVRGGRRIPLKASADQALALCAGTPKCLVFRHTGKDIPMTPGRDFCWKTLEARATADCPPEPMGAEDPLFILYTSGSTGKPKGVLHSCGGYLLHASLSHRHVFDYRDGEVYWCTADAGWVTGHSYIVYGPLANGATTLMFEGVPGYPDPGRFWQVVDRHNVNIFYTAPTAIRALMRHGDAPVTATSRKSLRILGSVGEPINPEAWLWYFNVVGNGRLPVCDTWWQTETGGIMITTFPGAHGMKPGSAGLPFYGVRPELVDADGNVITGEGEGSLCIAASWPGQIRTVYGNHQRYVDTYYSTWPGKYFAGDGCLRDSDGYYRITGRVDDVINVSGHRLGTAEIESCLVAHPMVSEAAVVGCPHPVKGQGIYAYVTTMDACTPDEELRRALVMQVRKDIGPLATPDCIHFTPDLPKTRSGKIMRRILRKIAADDAGDLGDTSTLLDPAIVDRLVKGRIAPRA